jgi:aldehyde:ferredoxin oxidoreductase
MEQQKPGGYNGKVLRVDLTRERMTVQRIDEAFCRKYLGGAGFIAHYLLAEVSQGIDPLGPENKLIFALGPLTGLPLGGCARHAVGGKSPLTGGIAKAEVGEHWGSQLKRAGFDALVIEGKAKGPVYLHIHAGEATLRDANHLWGKNTKETQESIQAELADSRIRVAMIGPGGEKQVKYACIMHGPFDAAGRGGLGAVMGSKNLKALAVRGNEMPPIINGAAIGNMARWLKGNMDLVKGYKELGTGGAMPRFASVGNLPVRNFRNGTFPNVDKISPTTIKETIRIGMEGCFACPVRCKKIVECHEPYQVDPAYGGPEYETLGALGSTCGIDNLPAVAKGAELCNAYSLDTISTGVSIAFAMECYERGLLTSEQTQGLRLEFGNAEAMLSMIEWIARREGIGNLFAEGAAMAAKQIGHGAEDFAMHVKGVEFPMHEPRLNQALGLGYMVNPHGADHCASLIDIFFSAFGDQPNVTIPEFASLGLEPAPFYGIDSRKVALFKAFQSKRIICDSLVLCMFLPYSFAQMAELTSAVTGYEASMTELIKVSERILTMFRLFNMREGLTAADDKLPARCFEPTLGGPLSDKPLDPEKMEAAKRTYYHLMGWDENGVPTNEKLEELGIDDFGLGK